MSECLRCRMGTLSTAPSPSRFISWSQSFSIQADCTSSRALRSLQSRLLRPARPLKAESTASSSSGSGGGGGGLVVLTREAGKNGKLRAALEGLGVGAASCLELPMVETAAGPDRHRLPQVLAERAADLDWVCVTSPEAAAVFLEGWRAAGAPPVRLAVVGDGTARVFAAAAAEGPAPQPQFVPSVANAEHFAPELPLRSGGSGVVLYPASNKASSELQAGLEVRGFSVLRLNTYDTLPVSAPLDPTLLAAARGAAVVTVGSPSAIKAWVQLVGEDATRGMAVACIGGTSARAAEKLGLQHIRCPEAPGVEAWAEVVVACLRERQLLRTAA